MIYDLYSLFCLFRGLIHLISCHGQTTPQKRDNIFSFQPLEVPIGLFFEKIAPIRVFNDDWHIIYHMNLTTLRAEFTNLEDTVINLRTICSTLDNNYNVKNLPIAKNLSSRHLSRECGSTFEQIELMMGNLKNFNAEWFVKPENSRHKRAPLNVVGTALRSVFGTLAQEDAEDYLHRFEVMTQHGVD